MGHVLRFKQLFVYISLALHVCQYVTHFIISHFLQLKLSGDFFEGLIAEAYDLGAVAEDCEHTMDDIGEQEEFTLPPYQEVRQ